MYSNEKQQTDLVIIEKLEQIITLLTEIKSGRIPPPEEREMVSRLREAFPEDEFTADEARDVLALDKSLIEIGKLLNAAGLPKRRTATGMRYRVSPASAKDRIKLPEDIGERVETVRKGWKAQGYGAQRRTTAKALSNWFYGGMKWTPAQARELIRRYPDVIGERIVD